MLVDIFSSFDDFNSIFFGKYYMMMWGGSFLAVLSFSLGFWVESTRWSMFLVALKKIVSGVVGSSNGVNMPMFMVIVTSMFLFFLCLNFCGLIPYVFGCSSHLAVGLSLSVPLSFSILWSSVHYASLTTVAHFYPVGAPMILGPFLVVVESISFFIRPFILALRLAANMTAGHIILGLLGGFMVSSLFNFSFSSIVMVLVEVFYHLFEFAVACIQAYIFILLLSLYMNDHASPALL